MRNLDPEKIEKYIVDPTFIKYFFRDEIIPSKSSFLNIIYRGDEYKFSIERLTIRKFWGDDYKKNNNRDIFNNSSFRIAMYFDGESQVYVDSKLTNITTSVLFLQSPGKQISVTPKVTSDCTVLEFYFDLTNRNKKQIDITVFEYLNRLFGIEVKDCREINNINHTIKNELQNLFTNLHEKLLESEISGSDYKSNLVIFNIFSKIGQMLTTDGGDEKNPAMNGVIRELKHNYKKDFTIEQLADIASLSKHYFQNLFKKTYGVTPMGYLNSIRIKHAKFMLKNYTYSCEVISSSVGFKNSFYFSKVFKKYTGLSPTAYRQSLK